MEQANHSFISHVKFHHFSQFEQLEIEFARHINIISGETSVGKTHLMKALYSIGKTLYDYETVKHSNKRLENKLEEKFKGVFHSDDIVQLITHGEKKASCEVNWTNGKVLHCQFSDDSISIVQYNEEKDRPKFVYLPVKEIISATTAFSHLYEQFKLPFEETYRDLSKMLSHDSKQSFVEYGKQVLSLLEEALNGKTVCENDCFYLMTHSGEKIDMGLVAEGYRKLATFMRLVENGTITENSIIFWDEPEANMNPKMVPLIKNLLVAFAKMGAQIFITTHSYFLIQELSLFSEYENDETLDLLFITLYRDEKTDAICYEAK